ncbi:MAG: hypothetical protein AB7D34_01215 [Sulfurimonas sp.]
MQNEITARPLVDILSERLGEQVVMSSTDYVLLGDKSVVATADVEAATLIQSDELAKAEAEAALSDYKQNGKIYTLGGVEYKVPFTKDDADGMLQVKAAFDMGLTSTNIHFSNGVVVPITTDDFLAFAVWFVEKRNSFFV